MSGGGSLPSLPGGAKRVESVAALVLGFALACSGAGLLPGCVLSPLGSDSTKGFGLRRLRRSRPKPLVESEFGPNLSLYLS